MVMSIVSEVRPIEPTKPGDASNAANVSRNALDNFRAELVTDFGNRGLMDKVFGLQGNRQAQVQDSGLDSVLPKLSIGGAGMDSGTGTLFDNVASRSTGGNSTLADAGTTADNAEGYLTDTGDTSGLSGLLALRAVVDQLRGRGKDSVLARLNSAINDFMSREGAKDLAIALGDFGDGQSLLSIAKNFGSPQAYRDYLASLKQQGRGETIA